MEEFINELFKTLKKKGFDISKDKFESPNSEELGDIAIPCFNITKGESPNTVAESIKSIIKTTTFNKKLKKIEVKGSYVNFFLKPEIISEKTLVKIYKEGVNYGKQNSGRNKPLIIEFSSPNIAKPFGIGHLRSTVIGQSLVNVFKSLNYDVVSLNHLGDWGTQFGKLMVAYTKWGDKKKLSEDPINYLLTLYVKFHKEAEKNDKLNDEAKEEFKKLEEGNQRSLKLWSLFKKLSLEDFQKIYELLGVSFDSYNGEAFINKKVQAAIKKLETKLKTEMSEGALIISLEKEKIPPLLLRKSDGATTYHSRDVAAIFYRLKEYKSSNLIYIVGSEQKLYFKQLFKVMEMYGFDKNKFKHVDFGLFQFPEGKMSTRKGNVVFLKDVLDKSIKLAESIIKEKNSDLKNKKEVAKMIGIGAIIFADLSNDRTRNINFDWDRMLSFEGETAPYLQYTHARSCSILRKTKITPSLNVDFKLYNKREELNVIKLLNNFPRIILKVAETYKPHHLANYLISLAQAFNEFYQTCSVLSEKTQLIKSRLLLVQSVRQTLKNGLGLLGIKAPEEM